MAACGQSSTPAGNRADLSRTAGQWPPAAVNKKQASESKRCLFFVLLFLAPGGGVSWWYLPLVVAGNTAGSIALHRITNAA